LAWRLFCDVTAGTGTEPIRFGPTFVAWEGIAVHHLQFEVTVAAVLGLVLLLGFVLIGLLHAATI
jgi:hypothetical protein